jgi:phosphoserine phosphatase RsbU/P
MGETDTAETLESAPVIRILLIEDNSGDARLVREALAEQGNTGYHIEHVTRLSAGLAVLASAGADLVLLDLSLPDSHGLDSLSRILPAAPDVPVVVMTGLDDETLAIRAVHAGAQDYLVKGQISGRALARVTRHAVERNRILSQLKHLDRLKSEFVSTVSHEMRTPLAIIREFVSLVYDGIPGPLTPEQVECLDAALRNCDRLTNLIDDLLDLAMIEAGKLKLSRRKADLQALLLQCHADFLPRCRAHDQELVLELEPELPAVLCDRSRIQQVVVNFLGNAHKFTPPRGRITLRASGHGSLVRIEVRDTGIGIAQTDQDFIFDAFTQINRREGPGPKGTGLGLTISKHIVHLHDGEISVESTRGQGSCFSFTLPVYVEGAELAAFVGDGAKVRRKDACLVLVRLAGRGMNGDRAVIPGLDSLRQVQDVAQNIFRDRDEVLLVESRSLLAFLLESGREGCLIAMGRLTEALVRRRPNARLEYTISELQEASERRDWSQLDDLSFTALRTGNARQERMRVLIVEDDASVLHHMVERLESTGLDLEIESTASGYDACIRFGELEPNLVILDLDLVEPAGREVLDSMKSTARGKSARFLAVSDARTVSRKARELGCDAFLNKSIGSEPFLKKISELLEVDEMDGHPSTSADR